MTFDPHEHFEVITDPDDNRQWVVRRLRDSQPMAYGPVHTMCHWIYVWGPMYV